MSRLRHVDCSAPGISRRRRGRGFEYLDRNGGRIDDPDVLQRIKDLAIPPAWKEVWICPHPNGHLQAVGTDDAGRKQYLYHRRWRERRDSEKFDHMVKFARALPSMRETVLEHLRDDGFSRRRVLACATRLLDRGFFRIGTEGYEEQNNTYGLATMKRRHVTVDGDLICFDYAAKGGKRRIQNIVDEEVAALVGALKRRRSGPDDLLAYKDGRSWVDVKSADIRAYIKEISGDDFTAKDFRTWNATVLAAVGVAVSTHAASSRSARKRAITRAVQEVAHYLGNTAAVCRASYIDPRVFDRFRSGWTIAPTLDLLGDRSSFGDLSGQGTIEQAVLDLLEKNTASEVIDKVA